MKEIEIGPKGHSSASWVCAALVRVGIHMATHLDQQFAEFGITQAQFRVLRAIQMSETKSIAPSALAGHLKVERAPISVLTNRLVERGLLARIPGENRRTFNLALTEAGTALMHQLLPTAITLAGAALKDFNEAQLSELRTMLITIEHSLSAGEKSDSTLKNSFNRNKMK